MTDTPCARCLGRKWVYTDDRSDTWSTKPCPDCAAPGPERCGHARYSPNTGIVACLDCGAVNNLGDGLGWTGGRP